MTEIRISDDPNSCSTKGGLFSPIVSFFVISVILKTLASMVFFVTGMIRYRAIQSYGWHNLNYAYHYTRFFKSKIALCALLIGSNLLSFILTLIPSKGLSWLGTCFYLVGSGKRLIDEREEDASLLLKHGTILSLCAYMV
jgi:hypothetical protein